MKKKNIGAAFTIVAALTAGASAYATTLDNLDQDQQTNSVLNDVSNVATYNDYDLVKAEYSKEVANTKVGENTKVETKEEKEENFAKLVEEAARETLVEVRADEEEVSLEEEPVEAIETSQAEIEEEVVEELPVEEETLEEEAYEEEAYQEDTEEDNKEVVKYVNTPLLNIRSSKDLEENNVIGYLTAGSKIVGYSKDGFLETEDGYLKEEFLSDTYPEELVKSEEERLAQEKAQKEAEAKKAEEERLAQEKAQKEAEAKKAEEERLAQEKAQKEAEAKKAEEERLAQEKAQKEAEAKKAEEERLAQEEAKKAEEERLAQEKAQKESEAKKAEEERLAQEKAQKEAENKTYYYQGWVNTEILNVRDSAGGNIIGSVNKGDYFEGNTEGSFLEIDYNGSKGYISMDYLSDTEVKADPVVVEEVVESPEDVVEETYEEEIPVVNNGSALGAVNAASQFIGYPYVWGASDPSTGFDCSGLTRYAYAQVGVSLPHQSAAQYSYGYEVDVNNLQAGDLVFFTSGGAIDHVGIVTSSDGTFIHASTPSTGVIYSNVYDSYYQSTLVGARRIF
ncbi:SH3 domain-containing C40 family peptidase [Anaerococcus sp. AGMB09787]|uniref:C40 family peptidase n=1 Tax=Anaerococcus sp. AGMB09787 TaxID=2922869 RepID=UPI001FAFBE15|nr:SH3 domain-containing C40 family peptidase [Anaerococcus sp. AGMB09787]